MMDADVMCGNRRLDDNRTTNRFDDYTQLRHIIILSITTIIYTPGIVWNFQHLSCDILYNIFFPPFYYAKNDAEHNNMQSTYARVQNDQSPSI